MTPGKFPPRTRIAPSPTGPPHVGTAYVAQFNRAFARKHGGAFVLRIEDTDRARSTRESEEQIFEALAWLGLDWDEGPDRGGPFAPYRQSERTEIYRKHVELLVARGAAYRCFCTPERLAELRAEQKARKSRFLGYDGRCRGLDPEEARRRAESGEPYVVRLAVPDEGETEFVDLLRGRIAIRNAEMDDQVLLKSDGYPTYHLANVVDDHLMEITHVLRAEEWIPSTPKHVLLYRAFGWEEPVFCHLPLLRNRDKSKISKRKNPTSLIWYREQGYLPEALKNFLALMGWSPRDGREIFSEEEFLEEFEPDQIRTTGPVFDLEKLDWLNGEYIRALPEEELAERVASFSGRPVDVVRPLLPLVRERMKTLADFEKVADYFFAEEVEIDPALFAGVKKATPAQCLEALRAAREIVASTEPFTKAGLEPALREAAERLGLKAGPFFMALRIAITGRTATPPLLESMEILGRERSLRRIDRAIEMLASQPA